MPASIPHSPSNSTARSSSKPASSSHPPLLLIHGFRGAPIGLSAIASDLRAAGYEVHTPAIPPFAGAPLLTSYTPSSYADFIASYIKSHHLSRPVLIGHSMGSIIAAATASLHPSLLSDQLILLSPISIPTAKPFRFIAPLSATLPPRLIDYLTTRFLFIPKDKKLFQETLSLTSACSSSTSSLRSVILASANFSSHYAISDFSLSQHVTLIAGAQDRLIPQKHTKNLATANNYTLHFLPGTGHLHNYEQPHETAALILKSLA